MDVTPEAEGVPGQWGYWDALGGVQEEVAALVGVEVHVTDVDPDSPASRRILADAVPL